MWRHLWKITNAKYKFQAGYDNIVSYWPWRRCMYALQTENKQTNKGTSVSAMISQQSTYIIFILIINHLQESISSTFYEQLLRAQILKVQKKTDKLNGFFYLLGFVRSKAPCRTLMKLTPGVIFIIILQGAFKLGARFTLIFLLHTIDSRDKSWTYN